MKLLCGLGNPGPDYRDTRHNVGYKICEILSQRHRIPFSSRRFSGRIGKGRIEGESVLLLKPATFMNLSGRSVAPAVRFYKIEPEDLVVIHDDVDLDPGRVIVKVGGGTAGHKGLRSVIAELGSADFIRVRFGVGRSQNPHIETSDFVLTSFSSEERTFIEERLAAAADAVEAILRDGHVAAANRINVRGNH